MGTYFRTVAYCQQVPQKSELESVLQNVNQVMSNYIPDSDVSQFNEAGAGEWFPVDPSLVQLLQIAVEVSERTRGSFDVTIKPLTDIWGFGDSAVDTKPTKERIQDALSQVDYRAIEMRLEPPSLRKQVPLAIDLSGIAKGWAVDQLATLYDNANCQHYIIDIGGEIRTNGLNSLGKPWQIGIEKPDGSGKVRVKLELSRGAVATTGDYRNVRVFDDERFSHLLDPSTGQPVGNNVASVTVYSETATEADALATGFFVLGEDALSLAVQNEIAVLFLLRHESDVDFTVRASPEMARLLTTDNDL